MVRKNSGAQGKKTRLASALERAQRTLTREILTTALAELPPTTTMGEVVDSLGEAGFGKDFQTLSLRDFVAAVGGAASAPARRAPRGTPASRSAATARRQVNTRTAQGRESLDQAVAGFLERRRTARAGDIRKSVGGTSNQVRQSLTRLMESKRVTKRGQKRGTEYSWSAAAAGAAPAGKRRKGRPSARKRRAARKRA